MLTALERSQRPRHRSCRAACSRTYPPEMSLAAGTAVPPRRTSLVWAARLPAGYQDLISGRGSSGQSGQTSASSGGRGQSGPSATAMDDTMRNVVASCAMIKQQQGSLVSRPSCLNDSVTQWCRKFQDKYPGCAAILADSGTHDPNQPISDGGYQSQQPSQAGGGVAGHFWTEVTAGRHQN
jgi:hypothetical protein